MGVVDWLVIGLYGLLMIGIGVFYSRQNQTAEDFVLGGRNMSPITVGLSLFSTLISTLTYLGYPGEMIAYGPMMVTQCAAHPLIYVLVGYGLIPLLMRQPVTSAYEILESRLGPRIRRAGAAVFLLMRLGWMATILYATTGVIIVPLLGLAPTWTPWICLLLGVITAGYSSAGGMKAVVMTDALQSLTMLAGAIVTVVAVTVRMGSVSAWWPSEWPAHWQAPNWGFDPEARISFGMLMLSTTLWYVCTNGSDQMSIQRFLSTRDASTARQTLAVSQITDVVVSLLLALTGVAVLGFYRVHPPKLQEGQTIASIADQLFPTFIMHEMSGGMAGLVLSAILSAAMSSLSSGVNSACAVIEKDFLTGLDDGSPGNAVVRMRWLTWTVAMLAVALSILNSAIEGNLVERCFKIINLLTAPLFVLFFLALFVRWANAAGAWLGLISSIAVAILIAYSKELGVSIGIGFVWMLPCSLIVGIVIGMVGSALAPNRRMQQTETHTTPAHA